MPDIKLSKTVPLPLRHRAPRKELRSTFGRMEIGASFEVSAKEVNRTTLYRLAGEAGIKVAVSGVRNSHNMELELYRVWRIE